MILVGVDLGRSAVKAMMVGQGERLRKRTFLSVVGQVGADRGLSPFLAAPEQNGRVRVRHTDRGGHDWVVDRYVGQAAIDRAEAAHADHSRERNPRDILALVAEALLRFQVSGDVALVTGSPVSYYQDVSTRNRLKAGWDQVREDTSGPTRASGLVMRKQVAGDHISVCGVITRMEEDEERGRTNLVLDKSVDVFLPYPNQIAAPVGREILVENARIVRDGRLLNLLLGPWEANGLRWKVADLEVVPEGAGVLYGAALDVFSRRRKDKTILAQTVGVIDVGVYSTDMVLMRAGVFQEPRSWSIPLGTSHILNALKMHLLDLLGVDLPLYALYAPLEEGQIMYGRPFDLTDIISAAAAGLFDALIAQVRARWERQLVSRLFLAGGGAYYLADHFRREFPQAEVVQDPEWANALGYLAFARWMPKWKNP